MPGVERISSATFSFRRSGPLKRCSKPARRRVGSWASTARTPGMMVRAPTSRMRAHARSISLFCASSSLRPPAPRQEPSAGWAAEPPRSAYPYLTLIFSQAARSPGSASDQERAASLARSATARYLRCSAARRSGSVRTTRRCRSAAGPAPGEFRSAAWSASGPACLRAARPGGGSASAGSGRPARSTPIVTIQPGTRFWLARPNAAAVYPLTLGKRLWPTLGSAEGHERRGHSGLTAQAGDRRLHRPVRFLDDAVAAYEALRLTTTASRSRGRGRARPWLDAQHAHLARRPAGQRPAAVTRVLPGRRLHGRRDR